MQHYVKFDHKVFHIVDELSRVLREDYGVKFLDRSYSGEDEYWIMDSNRENWTRIAFGRGLATQLVSYDLPPAFDEVLSVIRARPVPLYFNLNDGSYWK